VLWVGRRKQKSSITFVLQIAVHSGTGMLFEQGGGGRKYKIKVSFCPKFVNHRHQPKFQWEQRLAHSPVIQPERGSGGGAPNAWRF